MSLLTRVRVLGAKIEGTSGTVETLADADGAFNVINPVIQPTIAFTPREGQGGFGKIKGVTGPRGGTCTFRHHLYGDGAGGVPTWAALFLPACGWVNTAGTFSPRSEAPGSNVKTITIGVYENGKLKRLRGASGTFSIVCESGQPVALDFTFTGVYMDEAAGTILAPTYPTRAPIRFSGTTFTIAAAATPCFASLTFDAGNSVILRECPTAADNSGYFNAIITDRTPTGTINLESVLVATNAVYNKWVGHTEEALSLAVADANDRVTIACAAIQRTNKQEGDRNGVQIDDVTFQCNKSAGDDELTIAFSAVV